MASLNPEAPEFFPHGLYTYYYYQPTTYQMEHDGDQTTVMIRNIPSKYTRDMLIDFVEKHCKKLNQKDKDSGAEDVLAFDCFYLPLDFGTGLNRGYAFVNFTKSEGARKFRMTATNKKWEKFQSPKIRNIVAARLQGKEELEKHFEDMIFKCQYEEALPVFFSPPRDGVIKGEMRTVGKLVKP